VDLDPWIQYEFDDVKKLDVMTVWNSNGSAEAAIGWGVKEVQIEYSVDGQVWEALADAHQFSRAPGLPTYNQFDEIAFNGAAAKYVRLNIQSNWGGVLMSYGLSEVQFSMIPAQARMPKPATGVAEILPNSALTWRAGRAAAQHILYVGPDANAVADGSAPSVTSSTNRVDLGSLGLLLDQTYYWRVDEVNETESPSVWQGPLWDFSTVSYVTVDDFERYGNLSPNRPFQTWLDGFGYSADEFISVAFAGNGTGAGVGHDIWSLSSPHFDGQIMEGTIVRGGHLSMPLYFNNANGLSLSETEITFEQAQDWTASGIKTLSLNIYGDPGNTGQLYLKINNTRIDYGGLSDALQRTQWIPWNIDLSTLAGTLESVTSLTLGVDGAGISGVLYIDEIRLYPLAADMIAPVIPADSDPNLVAYYEFEGNVNDSKENYHGAAEGIPQYVAGKTGQAIEFDGVDDHVVHAFGQDEVWSAYSVSLWAKTETFAQGQYSALFNTDSVTSDFQIDVDGSAPGNYRHRGAVNTTLGPVTSEWIHLAASCNGIETSVYYNGLRVAVTATADTQLGQIGMGGNRGFTEHFNGVIDDVRVYNRALSAAEVAGLSGMTQSFSTSF
ncbi:MAG: discoidin domain-containing protein, partial [Phycisphaeraceae bacterium]|nr:discoidin domain-containing protein [Phycisphaeraceae bacterium]